MRVLAPALFAGAALRVTVATVTKFLRPRPSLLPLAVLPALGSPLLAQAAARDAGGLGSFSTWLMLPFFVAFGVAGHIALGRGAKAVAASFHPLASGEMELGGYDRSVYGTSDRAMLEVVAAAAAAGLVMWLGVALSFGWLTFLGVLGVVGAVAFDLSRWERMAVSANYVWFQRGFGRKVHQVAIENIRDVSVVEEEGTLPTPRHYKNSRLCRVMMRMHDKRAVALPKTDAHASLEAVENAANQIRARQQNLADRQKKDGKDGAAAARPDPEGGRMPTAGDKQMLKELRRLRQRSGDSGNTTSPPAVKANADSDF